MLAPMVTSADRADAVDPAALERLLASTSEQLEAYVDPAHHTFLDVYLARAHALHALDGDPAEVLRALWGASGCYAAHLSLYLERWPPHRIRSRRLLPLEIALIVRDEASLAVARGPAGLDAVELLAGVEAQAVSDELYELTPWFRYHRLGSAADFAGALAALYACGLTAIARADTDALTGYRAAIGTLMDAGARYAASAAGGLARLLAAHRALGALLPADTPTLLDALAEHGRLHAADFAQRLATDAEVAQTAAGALDTTSLALASAAAACGHDLTAALAQATAPGLAPLARYAPALLG